MDAVAPVARPSRAIPRRLLRLRSDVALAERFVEGDELAFAVLFERHRKSVLAVCMGVLGSRHDAEDAAQDAFAALAVSLRKGLPENLPAWLTRVARNAAIDVARRRRSNIRSEDVVPDQAVGAEGLKAELESVMAGIRELPESQRTALLMRELAGHSYREIAALLEVDEAAVRGLIARARISLRSHRAAAEMSCASARAALAAEPDGRRHDRTVRWHVRTCASCRAYKRALRDDARALRSLAPGPTVPIAGGGAMFGGLAAKGVLIGGVATQVTAACAVSVCAVGGIVLLAPHPGPPRAIGPGTPRGAVVRLVGARARPRSSSARDQTISELPAGLQAATSARVIARGWLGAKARGAPATSVAMTIGSRPGVSAPKRFAVPRGSSTAGSARFTGWGGRGYASGGTDAGADSGGQPPADLGRRDSNQATPAAYGRANGTGRGHSGLSSGGQPPSGGSGRTSGSPPPSAGSGTDGGGWWTGSDPASSERADRPVSQGVSEGLPGAGTGRSEPGSGGASRSGTVSPSGTAPPQPGAIVSGNRGSRRVHGGGWQTQG